ncbi:LON peptidase substrate-binding domain-containing protein [Arcicella sp. LKC2W]|uniref:LON peptidase substrate-binding domain-containing protein n=1 Tax=Arcicella sp. LKC2W TaxID=2984198 RepID=UPI002B1FB6DE|nr:LON peptidase substrate-binding domain-containing protein [Arcicella sp. LKC2W]MEA5458330.1 LON peptidase substrate-binding domain-containing protein [Arcicella sp. LKC2W]
MQKFLPLFPLNLVPFPLEDLNLHIFEPRYRQLINESLDNGTTFGIPVFLDGKLPGFGTEVKIIKLSKKYDDGRMDVKTQGIRTFRMIDFQNPVEMKLYAGGIVELLPEPEISPLVMAGLSQRVETLYQLLGEEHSFDTNKPQPYSYQIAHKIGLSLEEEYNLLKMPSEEERQGFLIQHLERVISVLQEVERTKERIKLNGHFKNLDPLNF